MPLGPEYDKQIDSQFADMKNTGGRNGGSITAAQFLQRFVDDTPWAHLDIAGTAMGAPKTEINQSWGSGYGVRLLDNPNAANVRFLIEGAPVPPDAQSYQRIVLVFDGDDEDAVTAARAQWSDAKAKGFDATYWQPDEQGRWVKKA
jgi:hypothetical protein